MGKNLTGVVLVLSLMLLPGGRVAEAQEHEHSAAEADAATPNLDVMEHIFCPTMKTGQLCSHGTAATLLLKDEKAEAWMALARTYNRAVNTATEQLFKDAEHVVTPEQLAELKAWFAVGMNPQINELIYAKGMGVRQPVASPPATDTETEK